MSARIELIDPSTKKRIKNKKTYDWDLIDVVDFFANNESGFDCHIYNPDESNYIEYLTKNEPALYAEGIEVAFNKESKRMMLIKRTPEGRYYHLRILRKHEAKQLSFA